MKEFPFHTENVVVAMDLTETDRSVAAYVNFLAERLPVKKVRNLYVFTAREFYQHVTSHGQFSRENPLLKEALTARMKKQVEVGEVYQRIKDVGYEMLVGSAVSELMHYVKDNQANLLVLGKKKQGAGILAKNAVRRITCPALIVPENAPRKLSRVLTPIDLSEASGQALRTAVALTRRAKQPVELIGLYIYEVPSLTTHNLMYFSEDFRQYVERNTREAVKGFLNRELGQGEHPEVEIVLLEEKFPSIGRRILHFAEEKDVDLIVMGTRGHSGLDAFFLGSVAEKVISKNDRTPTLVVK